MRGEQNFIICTDFFVPLLYIIWTRNNIANLFRMVMMEYGLSIPRVLILCASALLPYGLGSLSSVRRRNSASSLNFRRRLRCFADFADVCDMHEGALLITKA